MAPSEDVCEVVFTSVPSSPADTQGFHLDKRMPFGPDLLQQLLEDGRFGTLDDAGTFARAEDLGESSGSSVTPGAWSWRQGWRPSPLDTTALVFSARPAAKSCEGSSKPVGALKVTSARIALPDLACVVKLSDWLPADIARKDATSECTGAEIGQRFFNVSLPEWRVVVRRLVRCGLAAALPATSCPPELSGGAFAEKKDDNRVRFICDKRSQNSLEASVGRVMLPFCPRLRRLILHRACALGFHIVDTRNCFYLYEVDPARWHTQLVGPRIPASWLHNVFDESMDSLPADLLDSWWDSDLRTCPDAPEPPDDYR